MLHEKLENLNQKNVVGRDCLRMNSGGCARRDGGQPSAMETPEIKRAFERFKALPFPHGSSCDVTSDLHADLALYDTTMAGIITTLIQTGQVKPEYVSLLKPDTDLRTRLHAALGSKCAVVASDAGRYLEYLVAWEAIVQLAVDEVRSRMGGGDR